MSFFCFAFAGGRLHVVESVSVHVVLFLRDRKQMEREPALKKGKIEDAIVLNPLEDERPPPQPVSFVVCCFFV
jgi:hypothetical protein